MNKYRLDFALTDGKQQDIEVTANDKPDAMRFGSRTMASLIRQRGWQCKIKAMQITLVAENVEG